MFTRPGGRFGVSFPTGKSFESSGIFPCVSRYADMLDLHGFISEISMNIVYGYLTGWIWYIWSSWFSYPDQHTIYTLYSYYMYIYSNIYIYPNIYIYVLWIWNLHIPRYPMVNSCFTRWAHSNMAWTSRARPFRSSCATCPARGVTWPWPWALGFAGFSLWLCRNSYWKWSFIVDFPMKHGDFP